VNTEFLPEANQESREAVRYYEDEAPGVGMSFIAEVHRAISLALPVFPGAVGHVPWLLSRHSGERRSPEPRGPGFRRSPE